MSACEKSVVRSCVCPIRRYSNNTALEIMSHHAVKHAASAAGDETQRDSAPPRSHKSPFLCASTCDCMYSTAALESPNSTALVPPSASQPESRILCRWIAPKSAKTAAGSRFQVISSFKGSQLKHSHHSPASGTRPSFQQMVRSHVTNYVQLAAALSGNNVRGLKSQVFCI